MANTLIQTHALTMYYGRHRGIIDLNLNVQAGEVFGFLGPNGAGKTTTLRILLDIIRPTTGRAAIFGLDCQQEGVTIRRRVGYLPGELSLPTTMRGRSFLDMIDSLRGRPADPTYRRQLCERLNLDTSRRIREYSRGNKQKLGIVAAFMSQPDLLILDEPTTGLDPLVQQTVLDLVREARAAGRTTFFSSHILPEVQAVCDRVAIIRDGRLVQVERIDALTARPFHRLRLRFDSTPPPNLFTLDGVTEISRTGNTIILEVQRNLPDLLQAAAPYRILDIETQPVTLEEVFLAHYGNNGHTPNPNK
jgi:ABC-2 type transport system ATP-binding protein